MFLLQALMGIQYTQTPRLSVDHPLEGLLLTAAASLAAMSHCMQVEPILAAEISLCIGSGLKDLCPTKHDAFVGRICLWAGYPFAVDYHGCTELLQVFATA